MKIIYHTTQIENEEIIKKTGISPNKSDKLTVAQDTLQDKTGIYFFDNIDSAIEFGDDQNNEYVIFEITLFDDVKHIIDPEYDGEAIFIETDELIKVGDVIYKFEY